MYKTSKLMKNRSRSKLKRTVTRRKSRRSSLRSTQMMMKSKVNMKQPAPILSSSNKSMVTTRWLKMKIRTSR